MRVDSNIVSLLDLELLYLKYYISRGASGFALISHGDKTKGTTIDMKSLPYRYTPKMTILKEIKETMTKYYHLMLL